MSWLQCAWAACVRVCVAALAFWEPEAACATRPALVWMVVDCCAVVVATRPESGTLRRSATAALCGAVTSAVKCAATKRRNTSATDRPLTHSCDFLTNSICVKDYHHKKICYVCNYLFLNSALSSTPRWHLLIYIFWNTVKF